MSYPGTTVGVVSETPAGSSFLYQEADRQRREQLSWIDALDTKAGILLAADGVIASLVLTQNSILLRAPTSITLLVTVALGASLVLALLAFATRHYELAPDIDDLLTHDDLPETELKWAAMPSVLRALDVNQPKVDRKALYLSWAGVALLVGASSFTAYYVWFILFS